MNKSVHRKRILSYLAIAFSIIYLVWRAFCTLPVGYGILSMVLGIGLLIAELVGIISGTEQLIVISDKHLPKKNALSIDKYPHVDVFIATHNESEELLYKTINGCQNMIYPDKSKVHIYVCDDAERQEIRLLAAKMGVGYLGVIDNKLAKAGNLNYALSKTNSPLVATFDADMIPLHTFLMDTVPYFYDEEGNEKKVGFIQTPQSFYNADLFQYNLYSEDTVPNEQNFFFREINIVRNRSNSSIYAGSNTLISRKALDEVGGIAEGLITEDFATGIRIQKKGYECFATDKVEANGLAPNDIKSLVKQRERWARGCIQSLRKEHIIFSKDLNFKQKLSYFNSLLYWYNPLCRLMYLIAPILFGLFDIYVLDYTFVDMLYVWLPYFVLYNCAIKYASGNIRNSRLSNVYDTILFPYLLFPILLETLGIKKKKFSVTKKDNSNVGKSTIFYAIPHIIFAVLSILALIRCINIAIDTLSPYYLVVIGWLIYNLYAVIMAVFFIMGRRIERNVERFSVETEVEIHAKNGVFFGKTIDISDNGLSVKFDFPEYIDDDEIVTIICSTDRYKAGFKAKVVYFTNYNLDFKYAFQITDIDDINKRSYLNIIYDREPTLPEVIEGSASVFGEFSSNIHRRLKKYERNSRRLARINIYRKFKTFTNKEVFLYNFNYEYMYIGYSKNDNVDKNINLVLDGDIILQGKIVNDKPVIINDGRVAVLYTVDNLQEIIALKEFRSLLTEWINDYREYRKALDKKRKLREKNNEDELDEMQYVWEGSYNEKI